MMATPSFPKLRLGNIDAYRDWGHAEDYVNAMWLMMQQEEPEDYVIATGETYSVREFLIEAFNYIGIGNYEDYFVIDPEFYRPAEVEYLRGSPTGKDGDRIADDILKIFEEGIVFRGI